MKTKSATKPKKNNPSNRVVFIGIGCALLFWFVDAFIDAFIFKEGGLAYNLVFPGAMETWMRITVMFFTVGLSVYARKHIGEIRQAREEILIFHKFIETASEGFAMATLEGDITYLNPSLCRILGEEKAEETYGKPFLPYYSEESRQRLEDEILPAVMRDGQWSGELALLSSDGEVIPTIENIFLIRDSNGTPLCLADVMTSIAERKRVEERMEHLAYHDPLTELPNRALLIDRIDQVILRMQREHGLAAVLFIDLDRFKLINDTLGHDKGDEVLKAVAARLNKITRKADTLARHGGDEFIMVVQDLNSVADVMRVAERASSAFNAPFIIDGQEYSITASIGVSVYPNDGEDTGTLLKNADIAMYEKKDAGRSSFQLYDPSMNESIVKSLTLENKLRKAIAEGEFVLHYQPQVDIASGEVIGVEALLRWNEPELGIVPPGEFIPLAEDTGLIVPIGEWVLREACMQNKIWQNEGGKHITVAVNISMRQFKQKDFVGTVGRILKETNLDPKYLELEITESVIMDNMESAIQIMHELKGMGIRLSIDDFGTGYSSLQYLKLMPINMLKIAQSFVRDITVDANDAAIARAAIEVAKSMNLEVIAEGVETVEQLMLLSEHKCDKIQGFLFSKPKPPNDIKEFLKRDWRFAVEGSGLRGVG